MKCCLIIENELGYYIIEDYNKINGFNDLNETKLIDIVKFTNQFNNELELKEFLIATGKIPQKFINGTFKIAVINRNNNIKQLKYGISYRKDEELFDINNICNYILDNIKNDEFTKDFINSFKYSMDDANRNEIEKGYKNHIVNDTITSEFKSAIIIFIKNYINENKKMNFENLRFLAMFCINNKNINSNIDIEEKIGSLQLELLHYKILLEDNVLNEEEKKYYEEKLVEIKNELQMYKNTIKRVRD